MILIAEAKYVEGHQILVRYENGLEGIVDFSNQPRRGVFSDWDNMDFFRAFRVSEFGDTIEWSDNVDIAPEYIYSKVTGVPQEAAFSVMLADKEIWNAKKRLL
jgi:hypothetical protein